MNVIDLFGDTLLPGLSLGVDTVSESEERVMITHIDQAELNPFRFQQWTGKRLSRSYGWNYDFETGRFEPADPIPAWLLPLRACAAGFAGLQVDALAQALLLRYDPGAGIGWHRDRPVFEHVIGVSLGEAATMRFRKRTGIKFERCSAPLPPRSIYHLTGDARHRWEHSIVAMSGTRWSITFRTLVSEPQ